jgi:hypothetical protein
MEGMKVFISWSGEQSKQFGHLFREWLPRVLQSAKPYFTPADTEKGARWATDISEKLKQSDICIIILTRENLSSRWIMFEAGAISRSVDQAKVCPVLFGVEKTDVEPPLSIFQATSFNKDEIRQLLTVINRATNDASLSDKDLDVVFEKWWPDLEREVVAIASIQPSSAPQIRSQKDLVEENLLLTRALVMEQRRLSFVFEQLLDRLGPAQIGPRPGLVAPPQFGALFGTPLGDIGKPSAMGSILGDVTREHEAKKGSKEKPPDSE